MRPLVIGEANPYSADPRCALLPWPERAAGNRLRLILGLTEREYLRAFDRRNLVAGQRWSAREAKRVAWCILLAPETHQRPALILLGRKVAAAFGFADAPFWSDVPPVAPLPRAILLPHPSGRCRAWSEAGAVERTRALVAPLVAAVGEKPT